MNLRRTLLAEMEPSHSAPLQHPGRIDMVNALYFIFVLSGAAGLIYESIWTRYLGLFVGHDAYAQILVLVIFLGGMSAGAMAVSRWSERLKQPLYGYVAIEFVVGCIGLAFHDSFQVITAWAYHAVYPALAGSWALPAAKWGIAGGLILPQSVLLGMTFPLMSAGVLRLRQHSPGRQLSLLYFANSLGAAAGVVIAGFYLVERVGLPGTLRTAAVLNLLVAGTTLCVMAGARVAPAVSSGSSSPKPRSSSTTAAAGWKLERLLLLTSLGTAVASFIYEIGWIRMLALVLGSATHSFELMLSAFILGLAFGAWWIRARADRLKDQLRTLGLVQWAMGLLALATLPLYIYSFELIGFMVSTFTRNDAGYTGFTIARFVLCLAIMFPATFCAGMTLPLITRTLLANGSGERAIGAVYAWNTLGSILGVVLGGLVLLPLIGLKFMLIAGAAIDMCIGVLLLSRRKQGGNSPRRLVLAASLATIAILTFTGAGVRLDLNLLSSGVYRTGLITGPKEREVQFYRDGRTATVTVSRLKETGMVTLATNGKADASITPEWYRTCDSANVPAPLVGDAATQTLVPLVTLAHAPRARTAAVIGQGSGMSSHLVMGSPHIREVVTIEIEPQMIAGSRLLYPANRRVFDDPRSQIVIDDAKSYFASQQRRFDLIISEPSNPWVSGVSGLFTDEFYGRVRGYLSEDGVFGQWVQAYELDDSLVLSVMAALHRNFRAYEIYLVPTSDLLIVASNSPSLPSPDWSVFRAPTLQADLCRFVPLTPVVLGGLRLAGRAELEPLLQSFGPPNSDYYPILDLGAERRRFRRDTARGFRGLSTDWFNLLASMSGQRTGPGLDSIAALPENPRLRASATAALLRSRPAAHLPRDEFSPGIKHALQQLSSWQSVAVPVEPLVRWETWLQYAKRVDYLRNAGTAGTGDDELNATLNRFMERHHAPAPARDVVSFRHGMAAWKFAEAAAAGERLMPLASKKRGWIPADELRDGLVIARLHLSDIQGARQALDSLARFSTRPPDDLRSQLLAAYVEKAERLRP